jgi:hypothetical protein
MQCSSVNCYTYGFPFFFTVFPLAHWAQLRNLPGTRNPTCFHVFVCSFVFFFCFFRFSRHIGAPFWKLWRTFASLLAFRFYCVFTSKSHRFHFGVTYISLRSHFDITPLSFRFHCDLTSILLRAHFYST